MTFSASLNGFLIVSISLSLLSVCLAIINYEDSHYLGT